MKRRYLRLSSSIKFTLSFLIFLQLVSFCLQAQTKGKGEISGKIVDEENGEELIGASVLVKGTNMGGVANINGDFQLTSVPLGTQILEFSFVGYSKTEVSVNVQEGILVTLTVKLKPSNLLQEIVVMGSAEVQYSPIRNSTDIQLISKIKFSEGVLAGISNEQIAKSVDRDASQIVQRIAGVSLVDRFVVVRGLDPRYNMTLVNGLVGPSSEEGSRAFSFDAIPTGIIDRIEVEKSPGPHLPGMWGGGVIKIFTRNFTTTRAFNFDFSGAYRSSGSSFNDNFLTYNGSNKDWMANGAADRQLPGIMRSPNFVYPNFTNYPTENIAIARSPEFRSYVAQSSKSDLDKRLNLSYYDSWPIGKFRLNSLTALSYTQESVFRVTDIQDNAGVYLVADGTNKIDSVSNSDGSWFYRQGADEESVDSLYEKQIRISAVQSLGLLLNDNHNVSLTLFYNRFGTDQVSNREGFQQDAASETEKIFTYRYEQRDILVAQIGGSHRFGRNSLEWTGGGSTTRNNVPDLQRYHFYQPAASDTNLWTTRYGANFDKTFQAHYVFETEEASITGRIDFRRDFDNGMYIKAGGFYDRKERTFYSYQYGTYSNAPGNSAGLFEYPLQPLPWLKLDSLNGPEKFSTNNLYLRERDSQGAYFFDDQSAEGYLSVNYPIIRDRLTFYGGARVASYIRVLYDEFNVPTETGTIKGFFGRTHVVPDQRNFYFLPSGMLKYSFSNEKFVVRAVYGQSVDRPQFREQANVITYNFEQGINFYGNPSIENSYIHSADLRLEYYGKQSEFLAIGVFYKQIDKPILRFIGGTVLGGSRDGNYANAESATVMGTEIEIRKKFDFLSIPVIKNMSANINASYIWSEAKVDVPKSNIRNGEPSGVYTNFLLQGSSPIIVNAALYYERLQSGTLVSAIYNLTWDRVIDYAASPDVGNTVEGRRNRIDLVFKQRVNKFITVKAGVQDILNKPQLQYVDENNNYRYDPGINNAVQKNPTNVREVRSDYIRRSFKPGSYFSLGLSLNLQNNKTK